MIKEIQSNYTLNAVRVKAEEANIKLTEEQTKQISNLIVQKWAEIKIALQAEKRMTGELFNKIRATKIDEFEAEIKAQYPSIIQVAGKLLNQIYVGLKNFENEITGDWEDNWYPDVDKH